MPRPAPTFQPAAPGPAAPATPLPAPAPAAPSAAASAAASADWRGSLAAWLQSHRNYPDEARRRGDEGRAVVRFTVNRDGRVLDVSLVSSSGSTTLDDAALTMFRARLPAFPAGMAQDQITVTVPIRFTLER